MKFRNMKKEDIDKIQQEVEESFQISLENKHIKEDPLDKIYKEQLKMRNENKPTPKPKHFKNFNIVLSLDALNDSGYIYISPNSYKNPIKPDKHELVEGVFGYIYLDYYEDKIIGIEILDANKYLHLT